SNTSKMVFGVAEVIAYVTRTITLEPGDLIATGTPAGVGVFRKPPLFMQPGDEITIEIEGLGSLINPVVAGYRAPPARAARRPVPRRPRTAASDRRRRTADPGDPGRPRRLPRGRRTADHDPGSLHGRVRAAGTSGLAPVRYSARHRGLPRADRRVRD